MARPEPAPFFDGPEGADRLHRLLLEYGPMWQVQAGPPGGTGGGVLDPIGQARGQGLISLQQRIWIWIQCSTPQIQIQIHHYPLAFPPPLVRRLRGC